MKNLICYILLAFSFGALAQTSEKLNAHDECVFNTFMELSETKVGEKVVAFHNLIESSNQQGNEKLSKKYEKEQSMFVKLMLELSSKACE